jgi:hypothetical protein
MPSWFSSLAIVILFVFFIEILIARRVYRSARKNNRLKSTPQTQIFVISQPSNPQQGPLQHNTINGRPISPPPQTIPQFIFAQPQKGLLKTLWTRFAIVTCVGSVFLIIFLIISYLLRPFTNVWGLYLLPILLPLPFLALPSLLQSKTYSTFCFLMCGLGLGFLLLVLL